MKGTFIVIEGGDGAGKDTQVDLLKETLGEEHFLFVHDPGSTEIGLRLRETVLRDKRVTCSAELLIYLAARAQMVEERIKPALEEGIHVISNRFDLSTIAYQIYGRQRTDLLEFFKGVSDFARGGLIPDLLIFLDCPPEVGLRRTVESGKELDRFEEEKLAFHERVYAGYQKHIADYMHVRIDATATAKEVHEEVLKVVQKVVK